MNDAEVRDFCQDEEYSCHEKELNNLSGRDERHTGECSEANRSSAVQVASFSLHSQNPLSTAYLNVIWSDVKLPGSCIHINLLVKNVSKYRYNLNQFKEQKRDSSALSYPLF